MDVDQAVVPGPVWSTLATAAVAVEPQMTRRVTSGPMFARDGASQPGAVNVHSEVVVPDVTLPSVVDFGDVPKETSVTKTVRVFNTNLSAFATGGGQEARALAAKISDAWINFARTGDPGHPGLPVWPKYDTAGPVMVFDNTCEVKNDPDRELRKAVNRALS